MQRSIFDAEHDLFRESFRKFLDQHVAPHHERWERHKIVDRELWLEAGKQGFLGMAVPEQYGGGGVQDFRYNSIIAEELAKGGYSGPSFPLHNDIVAPYLMELTTDEQKQRWLPGFCSGEIITAIAMTEPECGSDLQGIKTRAVLDGDHWILNGAKTFISSGINSDLILVVAQTDPGHGSRSFSILAVERGMPGFERGRHLDKIGMPAQDTAELSFTDVRIPNENLLGERGKGLSYLMRNLPQERMSIAVTAAAAMESCLATTIDYVRNRRAFGNPIGAMQNIRFTLADLATETMAVRILVDRFITELNVGDLSAEEAAMAKLYATEAQVRLVDRCLQLHGGYGYMREYKIAKAYLDARVQTIYGGTSEIMREIISRAMRLS